MSELDPQALVRRLSADIPPGLHRHVVLVGSLAAAYHFRAALERHAVNTKDADVLVHPAGRLDACRRLAADLLALGWERHEDCHPSPAPRGRLMAIRLYPPRSRRYYLEVLGLPGPRQTQPVLWTPLRLDDGWYAVPRHRFLRLAVSGRMRSPEELDYAAPAMMALANLLSHTGVGVARMSRPAGGRLILRSAKDLGRVLALAWLEGREGAARWVAAWEAGLKACFPGRWRALARRAGTGLEALLADEGALREAWVTTDLGLLRGRGVTPENLRAVGRQVMADALDPLRRRASS
jgi:hypothetical protein